MTRALVELMIDGALSPQAMARGTPEAVTRVIERIGLESAGDLLVTLNPQQLRAALDDDAWRMDPGAGEDVFNPARFATWLEVLAQTGERSVVDRLNALDEDFLLMGLGSLFTVLTEDQWRLLVVQADAPDAFEKALNRDLLVEIGPYSVLKRFGDAERALPALHELHAGDGLFCEYLLERCSDLSFERFGLGLEEGDLRSRQDALEADVAAEREARRGERGYIATADARAWLKGLQARAKGSVGAPPSGRSDTALAPLPGRESLMIEAIRLLDASDRVKADALADELVRMANILAAGVWDDGAPLVAADAASACLAICDLALDAVTQDGPQYAQTSQAAAIVESQGVERIFVQGWRWLHGFAAHLLEQAEGPSVQPGWSALDGLRGELPVDPFAAANSRDRFINSLAHASRIEARLCAELQDASAVSLPPRIDHDHSV